MKNKPVLSIGNKAKKILEYINENEVLNATKVYKKFNLNGNGIYLKQLLEKGFIEKEKRGIYKITDNGKKLLEVIHQFENENI